MAINLSGGWFWYTYAKAIFITLLNVVGLKSVSRFKATNKIGSLHYLELPGKQQGFCWVEIKLTLGKALSPARGEYAERFSGPAHVGRD